MVAYIKSDLQFILDQIKIAENHALHTQTNGAQGKPLYGPGADGILGDNPATPLVNEGADDGSVPAYTLSFGLRQVDGRNNNLLPGQEEWGAADLPFPELLTPNYRPADGTPLVMGPGPAIPTSPNYNPSNNPNAIVVDASLRTISNLIVDQTLANPAAIMAALKNAGSPGDHLAIAVQIKALFTPIEGLFLALDAATVASTAATAAALAAAPDDPNLPALQQAATDAEVAKAAAQASLDGARGALDAALEANGIATDGNNVSIPNVSPDVGLSAPFNSWFTLFGQFFDHGLDLVNKGGSGTVFIPLQPDDPLYDPTSQTNFMVLTRATVSAGSDGVMGTADDVRPVNTTTPFVDQNQTYTSHSSHQVFLRQYAIGADGLPHATGKLIEGGGAQPGGMATWGEVKAQAANVLGIKLTDFDVGNVPLLRTDEYGNFIPDANGMPQLIVGIGVDGIPNTADDLVASGNLANPIDPTVVGALRIGHAFLADIAHNAVPTGKIADGDITIGLGNPGNSNTEYDNELLDAHFIAGDGRVNENIGLTAVHSIFHSEHNRLVEHTKETVLATRDLAFINEWLDIDLTQAQVNNIPTAVADIAAYAATLTWDGERLFQAAKFGTEMQYQHLVFEDFARKIQPNIDFFVVPDGYHADINPAIVAEFAHVVYRFGHSMLTEQIDRLDPSFNADQIGLIEGFLNPIEFDSNHTVADNIAAGDIIRGMTRQVGNEIDEFVTTALRNNLLGLPLDLATINLARGRDAGVPSLNAARVDFYEASNHASELKPYESWVDFAGNLKNEASVINFIAAYGTHSLITSQTTIEGRRDAALTLVTGTAWGNITITDPAIFEADRLAFLNATGSYAGGSLGGLNNIDLWIGGLAEKIPPFGGMLGSTFNFVFEVQLEQLQDGDRFYYLQRLDGLHLLSEMENNTFAKLILLNADAGHLPSDVFSTPGLILEVDRTKQWNPGLGETDALGNGLNDDPLTTNVDESADNLGNDPTGGSFLTPLVIRDNPGTVGPDSNYLRYTGTEHVLLGGTNGNDIIISSEGDDTLYGDAGNDRMEGGAGNDQYIGGDGDDIITDTFGDDIMRTGRGHDAVNAGQGVDLIVADEGQDFIVLGTDTLDEAFGGVGNDFVLGSKTTEQTLGGEGDDWIEVGAWTGAVGDNFDDQFVQDSVKGHDVFHGDGGFDEFVGEGGDDIWFQSLGRGKFDGLSGYDWTTAANMQLGVNVDLTLVQLPGTGVNTAIDTFTNVEGASGSKFNDTLRGTDVTAVDVPTEGFRGSALDAEGLAMIQGLQALLAGAGPESFDTQGRFVGGNILLGGDGSDVIEGRGGDDIIDGDKWLRVRIAVMSAFDDNGPTANSTALEYHDSMTTLVAKVFNGQINPGQLKIVRDIVSTGDNVADIDTAVYSDVRASYSFSATADGALIVSNTGGAAPLDGSDLLRNMERVQFTDGTLGIVVGTPHSDNGVAPQGAAPLNQPALNGSATDDIIIGLAGSDVLNGLGGNDILVGGPGASMTAATVADAFSAGNNNNQNGTANWASNWAETGDSGGTTTGQIQINGAGSGAGVLRFVGGTPAGSFDGAQIQRGVNLAGATGATLSYSIVEAVGADDTITVSFSRNGTTFVTVDTITSTTGNVLRSIDLTQFGTGAFTANAVLRFVSTSLETGDSVNIDNVSIAYTTPATNAGVDSLNGGLGNDTYAFGLGDGNDIINEAVNATSGGTADRISILAPITSEIDPLTGLPVVDAVNGLPLHVITGLNAFDSNTGTQTGDLVINYSLPTGATTSVAQQIAVAGHFGGTNAETGVERINFNNAMYAGYLLGVDDYFISRSDPNNRDAGGVNMSANSVTNAQANFVVGEQGVNDVITGGGLNDLIFGGTGDNDLVGGLGDDLLVGGNANGDNDELDSRLNAAGDDFAGALGADTMIGGVGNDTYGVDDVFDVVVEALNEGTDEVQTFLAALSIENVANVENLTYMGLDADQFVGIGNSLANLISGGQLADTLSGLGGNDTLDGELGADTMLGGDGNDVYFVDDVGDVVTEANADLVTGGTDGVESDISYTLGANVENLDLNGADADISGTGNALNNVINGNNGANQLFGGGGADTITGDDGNDLIDGGDGDDNIVGTTNDDNDTIIGGAGNDTINVTGGNDLVRYTASGFGNDTINNFDSVGGTAATQDLIDLSALGITAGNFATRVTIADVEDGTVDDTLITVYDASGITGGVVLGTIRLEELEATGANGVTAADFLLAAAAPIVPVAGATAGANTLTGTAGADLINGLGGNDTLNGLAGNDVINGGEGADTLNGGDGADTLSGGAGSDNGSFADDFNTASQSNSTGAFAWTAPWVETGDSGAVTAGQIRIDNGNNVLQFIGGTPAGNFDGAQIQRTVNLAGATAATLSYSIAETGLDAGDDTIAVMFSRDGTTFVQVDLINDATNTVANRTINLSLFGSGPFTANAAIRFVSSSLEANDSVNIDNLVVNFTTPGLNTGVDTINGDAGDDTIVWNANAAAPTDGRDIVNGGTEDAAGDSFQISGNASAEAYTIYTRAAWLAVGGGLNVAANLAATTEIVITRNGTNNAAVIAELNEIEEIRINSVDPSGATGNAGADTFTVVGDFSSTSLRLNTITIDGDAGDDTIDISALSSAHRIVFRSNGGHDTILGTLRPVDVIELPDGGTLADYVETTANGATTLTKGDHTISYTAASSGGPVVGPQDDDEEEEENQEEDENCDDGDVDGDDEDAAPAPVPGVPGVGTPNSDVLSGTAGDDMLDGLGSDDVLIGYAGNDLMLGGDGNDLLAGWNGSDLMYGGNGNDHMLGGADADILDGEAGADRIFGDHGNDLINGGDGNDTVVAGAGNDMITATEGDGDDTYFGDEISGGTGIDTLDMAAVTGGTTVDLGTGIGGHGSAVGAAGTDALWGIENVVTGSGNDTIIASNAVNVMDGGAGNDTFVFKSVAAANGDTIVGFQTGDRIDLSAIDADTGTGGAQAFTLVSGAATAAGQLGVNIEHHDGQDFTVITGNVNNTADPEFKITVEGVHTTITFI